MSLPALAEAAGLTDDELRAIEQGTATMTPSKALPEAQSPSSAAAARAAVAAAAVAAVEKACQEVPREAAAKLNKWLQAQADVLAPAPQDRARAWLGRQARAVLGPPQPLPAATLTVTQQQAGDTQGHGEAVPRGQSPQPQETDANDGTEDPLAGAVDSYRDWQRLLMQVRPSWTSFLRLMAVLFMPCTATPLGLPPLQLA